MTHKRLIEPAIISKTILSSILLLRTEVGGSYEGKHNMLSRRIDPHFAYFDREKIFTHQVPAQTELWFENELKV